MTSLSCELLRHRPVAEVVFFLGLYSAITDHRLYPSHVLADFSAELSGRIRAFSQKLAGAVAVKIVFEGVLAEAVLYAGTLVTL